MGVQGVATPSSNRRGSIISYFIRKGKISNAINNCYQANPLFQKFLDPGLLTYTLSRDGLAKGPKVDAVMKIEPPKDVPTLRSFLGSIQFMASSHQI